jgi:hypothetical protein
MLGAPGHGSGPERNGGVFALIVEHLAGGWAGVVVDRRVDMGVTDRRPLPGRVVGTRVPVVAPPAPSGMPQSVHLDVDELARVAALAAADAAAAGAVEPAQAVDTPTAPGPDGTVEAGMPRRRPDGSRGRRGLPPRCGDPASSSAHLQLGPWRGRLDRSSPGDAFGLEPQAPLVHRGGTRRLGVAPATTGEHSGHHREPTSWSLSSVAVQVRAAVWGIAGRQRHTATRLTSGRLRPLQASTTGGGGSRGTGKLAGELWCEPCHLGDLRHAWQRR